MCLIRVAPLCQMCLSISEGIDSLMRMAAALRDSRSQCDFPTLRVVEDLEPVGVIYRALDLIRCPRERDACT